MLERIDGFVRWTGACLVVAGGLFFLLGLMTPFLDLTDLRRDPMFAWRQTVAVLIGIALLFGSIGIYIRQLVNQPGRLRAFAFILAFIGSALLVALEWTELFLARDLATGFPDVFEKLEAAQGVTPFDLGTSIAAASFAMGWIVLSISTMTTTAVFSRWPGLIVIFGLFAVPVMTATVPMPYGPVVGSSVIAVGFVWLGRQVFRGSPAALSELR